MKRLGTAVVAVGMLLGMALTAQAQQTTTTEKKPLAVPGLDQQQNQRLEQLLTPPAFTVRFSGELRFQGVAWDNMLDFEDSTSNGAFRDSDSFYLGRLRLSTIVESADKAARATWTLEVGDIEWGRRGGASGAEYGCVGENQGANPPQTGVVTDSTGANVLLGPDGRPAVVRTTAPPLGGATRVGRSSGGCLGADGVNVETKHMNLWFQVPNVPGLTATIGAQGFQILDTRPGAFFGDDAWGIKLNWKMDPVDVELYTFKISENTFPNADDIDAYAARIGINAIPGLRLTVEGMVVNEMNRAGHSFGDNFWVGATAGATIGNISVDGTFLYGQRTLTCAAVSTGCDSNNMAEEAGYGAIVTALIPAGPVTVGVQGWYMSGDDTQGPAGFRSDLPAAVAKAPGAQLPGTSNGRLTKDSDKLPMVADEDSWVGLPYVAGWLFGSGTLIGGPGGGSNYTGSVGDMTGTYGVGAQVTFAVTPAVSIGGGVAYVGATDAAGPYGDAVIEVDAGATYQVNANLSFQVQGGVLFPDSGDMAYALGWRGRFAF